LREKERKKEINRSTSKRSVKEKVLKQPGDPSG
jgi:hypothetical protein